MEKILTIVIPTYNMEKYLDKCLTSLIVADKELLKKLEVLVVIDGAKDRSSEIAHSYQDKYPEVFRVIDKENGNYGSCVNRGLKEAKGKYIKILDADDYFCTTVFNNFIIFLQKIEADLIVSDFCSVNGQGSHTKEKHYPFKINQKVVPFDDSIAKLLLKYNLQMHAITYKTENLRAISYQQTEGISYTDQEWTFIPLSSVQTVVHFPQILYKYLVGRAGQTMDPQVFKKTISQNEICILKKLKFYLNDKTPNSSARLFQSTWIRWNLSKVYRWYLVEYPSLPKEGLVNFEMQIKGFAPNIIKESENFVLPGTLYHFVKAWRENKATYSSNILFRIAKLQSRIYGKIQRILTSQI